MNEAQLVAASEVTTKRLIDAVERDDREDLARIVNGLGLREARLLVAGLSVVAFGDMEQEA